MRKNLFEVRNKTGEMASDITAILHKFEEQLF